MYYILHATETNLYVISQDSSIYYYTIWGPHIKWS